jgi:glycosyltransferase involved in cell wall biosynthesis
MENRPVSNLEMAGRTTSRPLVAMFLHSTFRHDARVTREALALVDQGFDVVVFASAAGDGSDRGETWEGPLRVIRLEVHTAVRGLVRGLGAIIRLYARATRLTKRLLLRARGMKTPLRTRDAAGNEALTMDVPRSVHAALEGRRRIWRALAPVQALLKIIGFARLAARAAASMKPVAYHCHDMHAVPAGYLARRRHRAPLVYDAHELWPHRNRPGKRRTRSWLDERADGILCRTADAVITVNDSIARHMEHRYRLKREVVVVRNIPPLAAATEIPSAARIDDVPRPRLAYVGGLRSARGLEQIIDALPLITDGTFVALRSGDDAYRDSLSARAKALGVSERVVFIDPVSIEAVVPTIAQCDIGLSMIQGNHLSYYLSLPNKIFEYMHAGLAIVASDFPETRSLLETKGIGAVCDPASSEAIAAAVNGLLARPDELVRMRENSVKAAQELNWERERERLLAVYQRLVPGT